MSLNYIKKPKYKKECVCLRAHVSYTDTRIY